MATTGTAQAPLFDPPMGRLGRRTHGEVFGLLPSALGRSLDVPEVAAAVRPLLACGWRPAHLAARVGALPVSTDPVMAVVAFLGVLLERDSPAQAWDRERAERERQAAQRAADQAPVASEEVKAHWVAHARRSLGMPPRPRPAPTSTPPRACASCPGHGTFFVTREVRLCDACVDLLGTGRAQLSARA